MSDETPDIPENEIRVSKNVGIARYLRRAHQLFVKEEKTFDTVVLRAAGPAIGNVVPLAELIRRRIAGLHQNTEITTVTIEEFRKPREGGEERNFARTMIMLKITLSKNQLDKDSAGY